VRGGRHAGIKVGERARCRRIAGGRKPRRRSRAAPITEATAHAIGVQAYVYLYPLVTMDITRRQLTNIARAEGISAPPNSFANITEFPSATMRAVVRPNFDTLYSSGWVDLTTGRWYRLAGPAHFPRARVGSRRPPRTSGLSAGPRLTDRRLRCRAQGPGGLSNHSAVALGQAGRASHGTVDPAGDMKRRRRPRSTPCVPTDSSPMPPR